MNSNFFRTAFPIGLIVEFCLPLAHGELSQSRFSPSKLADEAPQLSYVNHEGKIWMDDEIGSGIERGTHSFGLRVGGAFSTHDLGGVMWHNMAFTQVSIGHLWETGGTRGRFYRGSWELAADVFFGLEFADGTHYAVGISPMTRYNFVTGTRWMPFIEWGPGLAATDIGRPDLGSIFQFNLQAGAGVNYFVSKRTAVNLSYRWIHLCSAGISRPNQGINENTFFFGVTRLF